MGAFLRRPAVAVAGLLYAIVLAASPALHHDLICHLKTPTHCTACHASPVAPRAEARVEVAPPVLSNAPSVESREEIAALAPVPLRSCGRAPPA